MTNFKFTCRVYAIFITGLLLFAIGPVITSPVITSPVMIGSVVMWSFKSIVLIIFGGLTSILGAVLMFYTVLLIRDAMYPNRFNK
jgi:hypothetical protein